MLKRTRKSDSNLSYNQIMEELFHSDVGEHILEQIMNPEQWQSNKKIPLRYRLIGLGFMKNQNLEELNDDLMEYGCRPLYSRNSFECTLVYAFYNRLSYERWKELYVMCNKAKEQLAQESDNKLQYFKGKNITFNELEQYVLNFSEVSEQGLFTKEITRAFDKEVENIGKDVREFFMFYISRLSDFTEVHEKARYYFCKYLYYHLLDKIKYYSQHVVDRMPTEAELAELSPLKIEVALRRRVTPGDELMDKIRKCSISPGKLFDEFNYYFFGFVSSNWVELLMENAVSIEEFSNEQIFMIADFYRKNSKDQHLKSLSDRQLIMEKMKQMQDDENSAKDRRGEKAIRKYIKGELDLDRTTLICFLLYFVSSITSRNEIRITVNRIDEILDECGFSMLRKKDPFDKFVINYIESKEPVDVLMNEIDKYIKSGKDFYIFEMYANSKSSARDALKILRK